MKQINMPPDAFALMESTRAIGYSLKTAIADIVDNSVAADAKNINIYYYPLDNPYVAILDDGLGMDDTELNIAMQYGGCGPRHKRKTKDLGRFGLGLKTASLSQCDVLTVISKKKDAITGRRWDLNYISQQSGWILQQLNDKEMQNLPKIDNLKSLKSGTLVIWQHLGRMQQGENVQQSMGIKMGEVRKHLSLVFHRYLQGEPGSIKKIRIAMNDNQIEAIDPFFSSKNTQIMDEEILTVQGKKIKIVPYVLPHISKLTQVEKKTLGDNDDLRKNQGFYVYRNKRLIVWGTWFGMARKSGISKLARIQVDIPNSFDDLWILDVKKSSAMPPSTVRKNLMSIIDAVLEKSKRPWTYRGKKETDGTIQHIWDRLEQTRDNGIIYEINKKHPIIENFKREFPGSERKLKSILKMIESSLPLNQLLVDLNGDTNIINNDLTEKEDVKRTLNDLLNRAPAANKKGLLEILRYTEPFNEFPDLFTE